jgi:23S rRNA G2445 N2-methylase RlmL
VVLDPMCGAGTILAEQLEARRGGGRVEVWGGDLDVRALRAAAANLRRLGEPRLARWDAARLPLPAGSVDRVVSNPPFGKQLGRPEEIGPLYARVVPEYDRVLRRDGRAVLLVGDPAPLRQAARRAGWQLEQQLRVRILGQRADLTVWRKGGGSATMTDES